MEDGEECILPGASLRENHVLQADSTKSEGDCVFGGH